MKTGAKIGIGIAVVLLLVACAGAYVFHRVAKAPTINTESDDPKMVYVYPNSSWAQVIDSLAEHVDIQHAGDLDLLLRKTQGTSTPKPGAYQIAPRTTTLQVYKQLAYGYQTPVRLVIPSVRLPQQMWHRLAPQLMMDSTMIAHAMTDTTLLRKVGVPDSTLAYYLLPNTYEVYWSMSPEQLVTRIKREWDSFWTPERKAKAEHLGLTPLDVVTVASIVSEESAKIDEYPTIAGLYLNRLSIGMPLQADPTVKYAVGDFSIRRILHEHLDVESPYNTYKHVGLPPTPIRIPMISAIDAVLNAQKHKYLYMCARADFSGYHDFAVSYAEHLRNARAYQRALDARGIK